MKRKLVLFLAFIMVATMSLSGCGGDKSADSAKSAMLKAYYDAIDIQYSLQVMDKLLTFGTNEKLGFRTAGSTAELAAGDYLHDEFEKIGLKNVIKDEVTVDTFDFKNAEISYQAADGGDITAQLAAFQTQYIADNETMDIVYVGKGTDTDYEGIDVTGKLVLLDIDQLNEWWINWPAYQAKVKGAKAVIAINTDGYCTYSDDTLGVQDYCGPSDAPAFTMTVKDGEVLKQAIEKNGGRLSVTFNVDSQVSTDGTSYNIMGEIPGKTDEVIYIIGHYDAYFRAFADNTSGIGCMLGIANALVKSGYEPEKTIRFVAHCAEEWGLADSRYDWARGAMLATEKHPEWADNGFMVINLDSGVVCSDAEGVEITAPYELAKGLVQIGKQVEGSPFEKFGSNSPTWTWTESFAYSILGLPVMDSGYSGTNHDGTYHSNKDLKKTNNYSDEAFQYAHRLYGSYVIAFDEMTVRPFDYGQLFKAMGKTVDKDIIADSDELLAAYEGAVKAADKLKEKSVTNEFSGAEALSFNQSMNEIFKKATKDLFTLDWNEEFQFVHQYKQTNVAMLSDAIESLEKGDVAKALDEDISAVDLNWYAYSFDKETYDYFVNQVLGPEARNSWGTGYLKSNADLWQVSRSLMEKKDAKAADYSAEINALKAELEIQKADLKAVTAKEIEDVKALTDRMTTLY